MIASPLKKHRDPLVGQLRKLIKPRTYLVGIWGIYVVWIEAAWKSDTSVSIESINPDLLSRKIKTPLTLKELQSALDKFQKEVTEFCEKSDNLAKQFGQKKAEFFEELLYEVEK